MTKALKITTANTIEPIELNEMTDYQDAVGGFFESIPLGDDHSLVINEEGKLEGLAPNRLATLLAFTFRSGIASDDIIVGNAVIVRNADDTGDWIDYDDALAEKIRELADTL